MKEAAKKIGLLNLSDLPTLEQAMYSMVSELFLGCRSITGNGLRQTLRAIQALIPLELFEVPTGTQVFDWTVPKEWNILDAYVKNSAGERVIDFRKSNLHVVNYSVPVRQFMPLAELKQHLFTLPNQPDWVPYRTSYYKETWGFCLTQHQFDALQEDQYEVVIDSTLQDGSLTYGECFLPGDSQEEVILSSHCCHPSLANDNLSGIALATYLARHIQNSPRRYSYRFLFIPGTIGAITWLSRNTEKKSRIRHGLVLTGVGDSGNLTYKKSRQGNAEIDRAAAHVLRHSGQGHQILDFSPYGYDERQFCSPGINLAVGRISRTPHGTFPEYHTSADNLNFVHPAKLGESFTACLEILSLLENNKTYVNLTPNCEPQLGKRGLYRMIGGPADAGLSEMAMLWVLNLSDGKHSLLDIAERSGLAFPAVRRASDLLHDHGLLREVDIGSSLSRASVLADKT
jgi:aminopeptidase-like protein